MKTLTKFLRKPMFSCFCAAALLAFPSCGGSGSEDPEPGTDDESAQNEKQKAPEVKEFDAATKAVIGKLNELTKSGLEEPDDPEPEILEVLQGVKVPDVDSFLAIVEALPKGGTETGAYEMLCYRMADDPKKALREIKQLSEGLSGEPLKLAFNSLFFEASDSEMPIDEAMAGITKADLGESTELMAIKELFSAYVENEPEDTKEAARNVPNPAHRAEAMAGARIKE